jgi:hypothetical protein
MQLDEQHHPPSKSGVSRRRQMRSQPDPQWGLAQVEKMPARMPAAAPPLNKREKEA